MIPTITGADPITPPGSCPAESVPRRRATMRCTTPIRQQEAATSLLGLLPIPNLMDRLMAYVEQARDMVEGD